MFKKNILTCQMLTKKIVGTYTDDYDITHIHDIIINLLTDEKRNLSILIDKLNHLSAIASKTQTFNAKRDTLEQIEKLQHDINMIKNGDKLNKYNALASPMLKNYINDTDKLLNINKYLKLAKNYIDINVTRVVLTTDSCLNCKNTLDVKNTSDTVVRCANCGNEHQLVNTLKHADTIKLNGNENDMDNFIKALTRYQGLQPCPPKMIYDKLDKYFKERGLPIGSEVRSLSYNDRGKKGNTNKEMLYTALSQTGNASYYEDVNLIGHIYWDWKLPNLVGLKDKILHHYIITQQSFYKISVEVRGRNSALGTNFRLYKHLQLVGHPCYEDDFKIAENAESLQTHKKLWKMMCELSDDPEIYYIE